MTVASVIRVDREARVASLARDKRETRVARKGSVVIVRMEPGCSGR